MTITHRTSPQLSWATSFTSERNSSTISSDALNDASLRDELIALGLDPSTGTQEGSINSFGFDFQRSTADNALNARKGYQLTFHVGGGWERASWHLQLLCGVGRCPPLSAAR